MGISESDELAVRELWQLLEGALSIAPHLRLLITSRRPLYSHDFVAAASSTGATGEANTDNYGRCTERGEPLTLMGRRREFLQQLAGHPLLAALGGSPADILAAAAEVTPQLPTLLSHSR